MGETRRAARMARLVAQWRTSGESGPSFARRHRIPTWTFWYWRRKLSAAPRAVAPTPVPRFVPVQVAGEPAAPVIEIELRGEESLHVRAGPSADLVWAAVSALWCSC